MRKVILSIDGMTCSACSNGLEKYLRKQEGIKNANVNLVMSTASIEYEDYLSLFDLEKFIKDAGFLSLGEVDFKKKDKKQSMLPFFLYGLLAFLIMVIPMAHHFHVSMPDFLNSHASPKTYTLFLILLTAPFLVFGFDILKSGIKNLVHKMPNMDTLVSIGVFSSLLYSLYSSILIFKGNHTYVESLYFESVVFVIYFIKLGRFIDKKAHEKTKDAISELVTITPQEARIKTDSGYKIVTIDEVNKGDILVGLAGDKIAVDGTILRGETHVDESFITGESKPVKKKIGDKVIAGSINYEGVIEYQAEYIGRESTISAIVRLVVEATSTKAPISLLADKICGYFVPSIIVISLLTFIGCICLGIPFQESLTRFVTVLVVACPCALGLATPLTIVVAEGVCAKKGILIKTSETLELVNHIDTIVFDKTGTLTKGNLSISEYCINHMQDNEFLTLLGKLEMNSTHPIAKGIMNTLKEKNIEVKDAFEVENIAGVGVKAKTKEGTYYACSANYIQELELDNPYEKEEENLTRKGNSIVYVLHDKKVLGIVGIKDIVREDAKTVIQALKSKGKQVIMLSGDHEQTASSIAHELGIEHVIANVLPREKADVIQKLKSEGKKVIMVGDGINDAPSLILADIGISISSGTDIATDSADVIFMQDKLRSIVDLFTIGKKTLRNIRQNLFWAFAYNICMIPLAMGFFPQIHLTPMLACLAMICSSFFVILNALRLKSLS